jgi:hypothetical protein
LITLTCQHLKTAENAVFSGTSVAPEADERWPLVISAVRMQCDWLFPSDRFLRCSYAVLAFGTSRHLRITNPLVGGLERLQIE